MKNFKEFLLCMLIVAGVFLIALPLLVWVAAWACVFIGKHGLPLWNVLPFPPGFF